VPWWPGGEEQAIAFRHLQPQAPHVRFSVACLEWPRSRMRGWPWWPCLTTSGLGPRLGGDSSNSRTDLLPIAYTLSRGRRGVIIILLGLRAGPKWRLTSLDSRFSQAVMIHIVSANVGLSLDSRQPSSSASTQGF